ELPDGHFPGVEKVSDPSTRRTVYQKVTLSEDIWRLYDIRTSNALRDIRPKVALYIGRALVLLQQKKAGKGNKLPLQIVVGRDTRASSRGIQDALMQGIRLQGANAIDLGAGTSPEHAIPTPLMYFA